MRTQDFRKVDFLLGVTHRKQVEHARFGASPQGCGGLSLWIKIDQQNMSSAQGKPMRQGNGGGGFSDPTFLVRNTNDFCGHVGSP